MKTKYLALAGAALVALSAGIAAADEQDEQVRQLNLEQLAKARGQSADQTTAPAPIAPDGQGGPEYQAPPAPEEGMSDEPSAGDDAATDEAPAPDQEEAPPAEEEDNKPSKPPI